MSNRKQYLINKLANVSIDDMSYWEEVMDLFKPTEVKEMRSRCLKGFGAEYGKKITSFDRFKTKYNEEDLKTFIVRKYYGEIDKSPVEIDNLYNHFFNKQRDGYVGWTEEDEEDYQFFLMFGCMPNDPIIYIRTASDESHFAAEQGEMRGAFGLGHDGDYDEPSDDFRMGIPEEDRDEGNRGWNSYAGEDYHEDHPNYWKGGPKI